MLLFRGLPTSNICCTYMKCRAAAIAPWNNSFLSMAAGRLAGGGFISGKSQRDRGAGPPASGEDWGPGSGVLPIVVGGAELLARLLPLSTVFGTVGREASNGEEEVEPGALSPELGMGSLGECARLWNALSATGLYRPVSCVSRARESSEHNLSIVSYKNVRHRTQHCIMMVCWSADIEWSGFSTKKCTSYVT